jgi:hypothetical protein
LSIAVAGSVAGCSVVSPESDDFTVQATVRFLNVEGGCWALDAANGTRYEPVGLTEAFREDGRRVTVRLDSTENLASFCMVGELVRVVEISDR